MFWRRMLEKILESEKFRQMLVEIVMEILSAVFEGEKLFDFSDEEKTAIKESAVKAAETAVSEALS